MARQQIDARTKTMSAAALACRKLGHAMTPVPVAAARRMELRQLGQYADRLICLRGCGRWREDVFAIDGDELVARSGDYLDKESYLVQQKGTGRLPREAARRAYRQRVGEPDVAPSVPVPEQWLQPAPRRRPARVVAAEQPAPDGPVEPAPKQRRRRAAGDRQPR